MGGVVVCPGVVVLCLPRGSYQGCYSVKSHPDTNIFLLPTFCSNGNYVRILKKIILFF